MSQARRHTKLGLILRVGVFAFFAFVIMVVATPLLRAVLDYLLAVVLGTFAAAVLANTLTLRIYEQAHLADIGLYWNASSLRHLGLGIGGGAGAALLVLAPPLLAGAAVLKPAPEAPLNWGTFFFITLVLLFGAVGEEMLFRGYAFQILVPALGSFATLLPMGVLFGIAHSNNFHISRLALFNTCAWGVVLGYAMLRGGDLWLPIGLHFGWNWTLPVFGVNVSGFTMRIAGYALEWKLDQVWSGGEYGPEGGLLCTAAVILLAAYLAQAPIRKQPSLLLRTRTEA